MARLIAMTLLAEEKELGSTMRDWFDSYCDFKIKQTDSQEALLNTSITAATGGLPTSIGMGLLETAFRNWTGRKR